MTKETKIILFEIMDKIEQRQCEIEAKKDYKSYKDEYHQLAKIWGRVYVTLISKEWNEYVKYLEKKYDKNIEKYQK